MHKYTQITVSLLCSCFIQIGIAQAATIMTEPSIAGISSDITISDIPPNTIGSVIVLPPYGDEIELPFNSQNALTAKVRLTSEQIQDAGIYHISALINQQIITESTLTVKPSSFDGQISSIEVSSSTLIADNKNSITAKVIARDTYGNTLAGRPMKIMTNRYQDTINQISKETDDHGIQLFSIQTNQPGIMTIQAIDLITGDTISSDIYVQVDAPTSTQTIAKGGPSQTNLFATNSNNTALQASLISGRSLYGQASGLKAVDHFIFEVSKNIQVNSDENMTIIAVDKNGSVAEDYEGTILLSSTDPNAILPSFGQVKFNGSDLGRKQLILGLRFLTPGSQLLYGEDSNDSTINGQVDITVNGKITNNDEKQKINIISPIPNSVVSTNSITIEGIGPEFINLVITGGLRDIASETDADGHFTANVTLDSTQTTHTLRVKSDTGNADSGPITISLDNKAPIITKLEFDPKIVSVGTDILTTVTIDEAESSIGTVSLSINNEAVPLKQTSEHTYNYVFTPKIDGFVTFKVTATDTAGNSADMQSMIEVQKKPVPTVKNVRGTLSDSLALLQWDEIPNATLYRIYVGTSDKKFEYTLETKLTEAKVNGIVPGTSYYFAITAMVEGRESPEKSTIVKLVSPNAKLRVTPGNGSLLLEWNNPIEDASIGSYQLKYGISEKNLTEERIINGAVSRYELSDLINETKYYMQLTPITITGEIINQAKAVADGTPSGDALHSGAPDPIPSDLLGQISDGGKGKGKGKGDNLIIKDIPSQPETGLPTSSIVLSILFVISIMYVYIKRKENKEHKLFLEYMQTQYSNHSS